MVAAAPIAAVHIEIFADFALRRPDLAALPRGDAVALPADVRLLALLVIENDSLQDDSGGAGDHDFAPSGPRRPVAALRFESSSHTGPASGQVMSPEEATVHRNRSITGHPVAAWRLAGEWHHLDCVPVPDRRGRYRTVRLSYLGPV